MGDALGITLEFKSPGTFTPLTDIVGGGPFNLRAGQWTDDTSMAPCLAESLVACGGFDPIDQMRRYVRWYREGYMSPTGRCFDIGNTVRAALEHEIFSKPLSSYDWTGDLLYPTRKITNHPDAEAVVPALHYAQYWQGRTMGPRGSCALLMMATFGEC